MLERVTDPEILKQLESDNNQYKTVTDENILSQLNSSEKPQKELSQLDILKDIMTGKVFGQKGFTQPRTLAEMVIRALPHLKEDVTKSLRNASDVVSEGAGPLTEQIGKEPTRYMRNVMGHTIGLGANILNTILGIPGSLAHNELLNPETAKSIEKYIRPIPKEPVENYIQKLVGEPKNEADRLIGDIVENLLVVAPATKFGVTGAKAIGSAGGTAGRKILGSSNPILEADKLKQELLIGGKEKELGEAQNAHEAQQQSYQEAQNKAKNVGVATDHEKLVNTINEHDEKINQARVKSEELQKNLEEMPEPPKVPEKPSERNIIKPEKLEFHEPEKPEVISKEYEERANKAHENYLHTEDNLTKAKEYHEDATELAEDADKNISRYVESGALHGVRGPRAIIPDLNNIKNKGNNLYNKFEESIDNLNVTLQPSKSYKQINEELAKLVNETKDIKLMSPEAQELLQQLNTLNILESIPVKQYWNAIKAVKGYMRDAYEKSGEPLINEDKRTFLKKQAKEAEVELNKMNQLLKDTIGAKKYSKLEEANEYWRKNMIPLWKEPLYWQIMGDKQRMSNNMAHELRGGKEGSGLEIIRNIFKKNPQATKHIIGQAYDAKRPLNNELMKEYTDQLPDFNKLLKQKNLSDLMLKNSKKQIEEATKKKDIAKQHSSRTNNEAIRARQEQGKREKEYNAKLKEHKANVSKQEKSEKEYHKELSDYEKEKNKYHKELKSYGEQTKEHTKKVSKAEKDIKDHEKHIDKLIDTRKKLEHHEGKLRKEFNAKEITLKEKNRIGNELSDLKKERSKLESEIDKSTTGLRFLIKGIKVLYKAAKKYAGSL